MSASQKRHLSQHRIFDTGKAWVMSTHPGPSLVVAALTTFFAAMSGAPGGAIAVVFLAMLANQTGIGLGNDWWDATRDQESGRIDKPVANGRLPRQAVLGVALGLGALALGLSSLLGLWALGLQVLMLAAGWWYNVVAKFQWASPLSYVLGFGLLPAFALSWHQGVVVPAWWVFVVAALLGVSAHFANALPDLHDDSLAGVRGAPQIVGPQWSGIIVLVAVLVSTGLIAGLATGSPVIFRILMFTVAIGLALWATVMAFWPTPPRIIFPIVMLLAGLCVVGLGFSL